MVSDRLETLDELNRELGEPIEAETDLPPDPDEPDPEPDQDIPQGEPPPDPEPGFDELDDETMGNLIQALTHYLAGRYGPHWIASPIEANHIGKCFNKVMIKYAPLLARYQEEAALGLALFAYILPRLAVRIPAPVEPEAEPEAEPGADAAAGE